MMTGVDIRTADVLAVAVDEAGAISARASVATGADAAEAAIAAVERVTPASSGPSPLGIAMANLDSPVAARVLESLTSRYPDLFPQTAIIGAGTAAAVAEAWTGAARGVADVVYFSVAEHAVAGVVRHGRAATGAHGREPAVAWLSLNPVEREDYRKAGCLEAEVAAAGLVRRLLHRSADREVRPELDGVRRERLRLALYLELLGRRRGLLAGEPLLGAAPGHRKKDQGDHARDSRLRHWFTLLS